MERKECFHIRLEDLRFYSHIGIAEQERLVGNEFRVDMHLTLTADCFRAEELTSTVSYADAYAMVEKVMQQTHLLLESVAMEIADSISIKWPQVERVAVKITKLSVPIDKMNGSASVEYVSEKICEK